MKKSMYTPDIRKEIKERDKLKKKLKKVEKRISHLRELRSVEREMARRGASKKPKPSKR